MKLADIGYTTPKGWELGHRHKVIAEHGINDMDIPLFSPLHRG
jgi:hypothetical protein